MKIKKINKKVDELLIEWVKKVLPEDEQVKVNKNNINSLLPKEEYIESKRTFYMAFYTYRWAKQGIKKLLKAGYNLEQITIEDLKTLMTRVKPKGEIL